MRSEGVRIGEALPEEGPTDLLPGMLFMRPGGAEVQPPPDSVFLVVNGLSHSYASVLAHIKFVERFIFLLTWEEQRKDDRRQEFRGDAHDARVLSGKRGLSRPK